MERNCFFFFDAKLGGASPPSSSSSLVIVRGGFAGCLIKADTLDSGFIVASEPSPSELALSSKPVHTYLRDERRERMVGDEGRRAVASSSRLRVCDVVDCASLRLVEVHVVAELASDITDVESNLPAFDAGVPTDPAVLAASSGKNVEKVGIPTVGVFQSEA